MHTAEGCMERINGEMVHSRIRGRMHASGHVRPCRQVLRGAERNRLSTKRMPDSPLFHRVPVVVSLCLLSWPRRVGSFGGFARRTRGYIQSPHPTDLLQVSTQLHDSLPESHQLVFEFLVLRDMCRHRLARLYQLHDLREHDSLLLGASYCGMPARDLYHPTLADHSRPVGQINLHPPY